MIAHGIIPCQIEFAILGLLAFVPLAVRGVLVWLRAGRCGRCTVEHVREAHDDK